MKIDIVVYGPHGRHVLGRADVLTSNWINGMPSKVLEDLSVGLFTEQLELVLHRKRVDAVAKHKLKLIPITDPFFSEMLYLFQCEHCDKRSYVGKSKVRKLLTKRAHGPLLLRNIIANFGACKVLTEVEVT